MAKKPEIMIIDGGSIRMSDYTHILSNLNDTPCLACEEGLPLYVTTCIDTDQQIYVRKKVTSTMPSYAVILPEDKVQKKLSYIAKQKQIPKFLRGKRK